MYIYCYQSQPTLNEMCLIVLIDNVHDQPLCLRAEIAESIGCDVNEQSRCQHWLVKVKYQLCVLHVYSGTRTPARVKVYARAAHLQCTLTYTLTLYP